MKIPQLKIYLSFVDIRVNQLQTGDREGGSFTGSGLSLSDSVSSFQQRENSFLLDYGRLFVTVTFKRIREGYLEKII